MRWSNNKHKWHRWFAWYPMTITNQRTNEDITVWWEHIARKEIMGNYFPYYIYHPDPNYNGESGSLMEDENESQRTV